MNLLITGAWKCTPEQLDSIKAMGHSVTFLQNEQDALPIPYESVEGVICNGLFTRHPIERFTALRHVQLTSAGLDRVPVEYIREKGIALYNAHGVYSIPMAEYVLSGVLQIYRQSRFFSESQKQHAWVKRRDLPELNGKTVCILGCGDVGTECAKRFRAFGCKIIGLNRTEKEDPVFDEVFPLDSLSEVAVNADVLVVTVALAAGTCYLVNREVIASLKPGCVLVNVARGAIVDTAALIETLKEKKISAVLDVFEDEPLRPDHPLWDLENVILTPHNSFTGDGNENRLFCLIKQHLQETLV